MKTDGTPLHGSYFDLAAAKHPDLKDATSEGRRRPLMKRRRVRFGVLPVVLLGALVGVAWLVIALRPEENVRAAVEARDLPIAPTRQEVEPAAVGSQVAGQVDRSREAEPEVAVNRAPQRVPEPPASISEEKTLELAAPPAAVSGEASQATVDEEDVAESAKLARVPPASAAIPVRRDAELEVAELDAPEAPAVVAPAVGAPAVANSPPPLPVVPARKIFAPSPEYPEAAEREGEEGTVVVKTDIDASGNVTRATVVRGRSPALDAAAVAALQTWRFEPATRGGIAIASSYRIGVKFALPEAAEVPALGAGELAPSGPFEVGGEVEPPRRLTAPLPVYPNAAWVRGVTGDVLVRAVIDEEGNVADVEVLRGLPHGLTEAAVAAVRRWTFMPAKRHGQPVAVYRNLSVRFEG